MRIGFDLTPLTQTRTGVGQYTFYLLRNMMKRAPEHAYVGFATGWNPPDLRALPPLNGVHRVRLPTRAVYRLWNIAGKPRVDDWLGGVDVFHATNYVLPPVTRAPRVVTFHDLAFLRDRNWGSPKIAAAFARGVRRYAQGADCVIACSEATRRDAIELLGVGPAKVVTVYEAADVAFGQMTRPEAVDILAQRYDLQQPYLLFVGTLEPRKNVETLLGAFAEIARHVPHTLVLAGRDGWGMRPIERALADPRLADRVRRIGYVPTHRDLAAFYAAAEALVFPSHYEGFGLPVLEAMACGCPVVCSDRAALPEIAGDAARYVDPADLDGLAATLRLVCEHDSLREQMTRRGRAQAEKFSWARCADETLEVYKRAAACAS